MTNTRKYGTKAGIGIYYKERADGLQAEIRRLKKKNRTYVALELLTFCTAVAAVAVYCTVSAHAALLWAAAAMLAAYVGVRRADVRNGELTDRLTRLRMVYEKELSGISGNYACFGDGSAYIDPHHAFTFDMDVYGRDSLYNRIDRTVTTGGSDTLAAWLGSLLPDVEAVSRRRAAITELAGMETWRADFMAAGQSIADGAGKPNRRIDTGTILQVTGEIAAPSGSHGGGELRSSDKANQSSPKGGVGGGCFVDAPRAGGSLALAAAWGGIVGLALLVVLAVAGVLPAVVATMWATLQMFLSIGLNAKSIRRISRAVDRLHAGLHSYIGLIRLLGSAEFESAELKSLQAQLTEGSGSALESFGRLSEILKSLDRRGNFIGLILFNMFALSDFFLVRKFLRWQRLYMGSIARWTDCVSQFDALVSLATFRFNEPSATDAVVTDADGVEFRAEGLRHPFLGESAVGNDFSISDGNYYIITGANMAGKSTFLRSIGVNYLLAMNGAPVFAGSLRVSVFGLFSSMRTSDDLSRGISYFNAELLRLRQLIDNCRSGGRTLIILDEILKGTNSLDKLNGSRLFLQAVAKLPVTGVIATHDLELSRMEDDDPQRFHNWCFEIELADNITYNYKITRGVARNQNATFLLKNILKD